MTEPAYKPLFPSAWPAFDPIERAVAPCTCQETMLSQIKRRDWGTIIGDLQKAGLSLHEIGRRIGKADTSILHWMTSNGEPKDSDARRVLALHRKHCEAING